MRHLHRYLALFATLVGLAMSPSASAQSTDPLFDALGGRAGIVAITDDLVTLLAADPKIGSFFAHTDLPELKRQLADQFCAVAGGPCVYAGATMKKAHDDMHIRRADFNRLVELLQLAMDAHNVPFAEQNRLLARLAPMHRDVIERVAVRRALGQRTGTDERKFAP